MLRERGRGRVGIHVAGARYFRDRRLDRNPCAGDLVEPEGVNSQPEKRRGAPNASAAAIIIPGRLKPVFVPRKPFRVY